MRQLRLFAKKHRMSLRNEIKKTESDYSQVLCGKYTGLYGCARKNSIVCLEQIIAFYAENPHVELKDIPLNHKFTLMLKDVKSLLYLMKGQYGRIKQNDLLGFLFFAEMLTTQKEESEISINRFFFLLSIFHYLILHSISGNKRYENVKLFDLDKYDLLYTEIKNES